MSSNRVLFKPVSPGAYRRAKELAMKAARKASNQRALEVKPPKNTTVPRRMGNANRAKRTV